MKRLFPALLCLLFFAAGSSVFAQAPKFTKAQIEAFNATRPPISPLPDYLLAENANPAVFLSMKRAGQRVKSAGGVIGLATLVASKREANKLFTGDATQEQFASFMLEDLEELGINVSFVANYEALKAAEMSEIEIDNFIRQKLHENKSRYVIFMSVLSSPETKQVEKGKTDRSSYASILIRIGAYTGGSVFSAEAGNWEYFNTTLHYPMAIEDLENGISEKQDEFVSQLEDHAYFSEPFTAFKAFDGLPEDLAEQTLAIDQVYAAKYDRKTKKYSTELSESGNEATKKSMSKYPYAYELVDPYGGPSNHRYKLELKAAELLKRKYGSGEGITSQIVNRYYYVIRDTQTNDVYYGGDLAVLEEKADRVSITALNDFVKRVNALK